jgi:hypothetical protein
MSVSQRIWQVGQPPQRLFESKLASEQELEEMIAAKPEIVSDEWMVIGRQEETGFGGRIDLLAIAPDSSLVLIELKRDRTPRDVVAQALDYATWVEALDAEAVLRIYARFKAKSQEHGDLAKDFEARFGTPLDAEVFPGQHQIVIVASALDASSERIVSYLGKRAVAINVLCFEVFDHGPEKFLSRAWLRDPVEAQAASSSGSAGSSAGSWNGEYYVSYGGKTRSWDEAVKYGFVSAGGGAWYSNTLKLLKPGDRIWVKVPGKGFVGVGRVTGFSTPLPEFRVRVDGQDVPASDVIAGGQLDLTADPDKMEYFVPVDWAQAVTEDHAINEPGLFGNPNTVCAPKSPAWRTTIERLRSAFPGYDSI